MFYRIVKRVFDITGSLLGLALLSPVMLVTALAVYIDDPGPVFFSQDRIGKNLCIFKMYKFRSMVIDAERKLKNLSEAEKKEFLTDFKLKEDPRITHIGKFLRRTSIDELPQLLNVLKGDMSLVGPRPPLLMEKEAYGEHLDTVMSVRPGVTGYWQVHGRNDVDFSERIAMNEYYIANRSVGMDLRILLGTVRAVILGRGAI